MRPPPGFESQKFPLRHKMYYAAGLNPVTAKKNTAAFLVMRNYKGANAPSTVDVNPHNSNYVTETGTICNPMSIIDSLKIKLNFNYYSPATGVKDEPIKLWWQPIFGSFPEKLDAADDVSGTTVATILQLVKDATQEDVTPLYGNTKHDVAGSSDRSQPASTVNLTEVFGDLNMDTDLTSEGIDWDDALVQEAMQSYTNKGALKACLGRRRYMTLGPNKRHMSYYIDKKPPSPIRRVMPYSFMVILVHMPLVTENDQLYYGVAPTATIAHVGATCKIRYHEWHFDHNQDQAGT